MITREFKLYLNAGVGVAPVINANQFDQGEEWIFTLLQSDGTVYTPSTGAIIGLKQDGTTILNAGTVNSSGQVVITETEQITAVPGSNLFEILIDGNTHGTANFVVFVERRPGDIDNPSESDISLFQEAIEAAGNVTQFQADISALQSGLATTNANLTSEANTRASADATLQSNISAEASTRQTQDAVLQAEIDQIIAPTGEAPSAAEVQNARIGVDGTTYDTLGNAIRTQVSDLKNALTDLASVKSEISFSQAGNSAIALNMAIGQTVSLTPYQTSSNTWRYAIVPCSAGQKVEIDLTGGSTPRAYGFIDENNILLAVANYGHVEDTVIAPANTSKLIVQDNSGTGTAYFISLDGRVDIIEQEVDDLKEEIDKSSIDVIVGNNIYDSSKNVYGKMFYESNNNVIWYENEYTTEYTSVIIPVESEYVTLSSNNVGTRLARYYFTTSDTLPTGIISSAIPNQDIGTGYTVQVPDGATFMCCSFRNLSENTPMMVNKGQTALPYEPYSIGYYVNGEKIQMESNTDIEYIKAPSEYNLVVGDTFQLFYKGIINVVHPENYDVVINCSKGKAFERFYEITPSVAETLTMTISLYGLNHELLESKLVSLNIHEKASSPSTVKNVLCVGDSLTVNGEWSKELYRRLTQTGGTPEGDGLSNINFIGTKVSNGVHYEGYGGWTFRSYNTENVSENSKVITCTHDKTQDDQHSIYRASNNSTWKLETIESGQIKILNVSGSPSTFPSTGTLTWVSGGTNHSDIVYTASVNSSGNPFWNSVTGKVDFANYATNLGVSTIDYVYVLLGWNSAGTKEADYKAMAQTFIDNVHASFPDAEIILVGLEIPARDGLANNYGATGLYSQYYTLMQYVFDLDNWYDDLSADNTNVSHFNLSGQFDTENNMQTATRQVNVRNSNTETYQSNGVHPANSGYMQIADAVYRDITAKL